MDSEVLFRPFATLSKGEQTKVLLAALFLKEGHFLLIDEPTNHLDTQARDLVSAYLRRKQGFILVSHDRHFLDGCVDHILSLNRANITVQNEMCIRDSHSTLLRNVNGFPASPPVWSERISKWSKDVYKRQDGRRPHGPHGNADIRPGENRSVVDAIPHKGQLLFCRLLLQHLLDVYKRQAVLVRIQLCLHKDL